MAVRALSAAPPRLVIRHAARELAAVGFVVTAIDSTSTLRAEREHPPGEFEGTLTCRTGDTPDRAAMIAPTMIIDLAVLPHDTGSELVVASRVNAAYLRLSSAPTRPMDTSDCQSTGVIEHRLAERLAASP
ncbi:MAG TPA: hypothetical protein VFI52_10630 [Gemmatimonadaceae bacterium]|nr:hypothetical protein [Gemmatimonadaceae bacterium]